MTRHEQLARLERLADVAGSIFGVVDLVLGITCALAVALGGQPRWLLTTCAFIGIGCALAVGATTPRRPA